MIERQTVIDIFIISLVSSSLLLSVFNPFNASGIQNYQPHNNYNDVTENRQIVNESRLWHVVLTNKIEYRFEKGIRSEPFIFSAHLRSDLTELWRVEQNFVYTPVTTIDDDIIVMDLVNGYEDEKFYMRRYSQTGTYDEFYLTDETWVSNENIFRRGRNFHFQVEETTLTAAFISQSDSSGVNKLQVISYNLASKKQLSYSFVDIDCILLEEVVFTPRELYTYCKNRVGNQVQLRRTEISRFSMEPIISNIIVSQPDNADFDIAADENGYVVSENVFDPEINNYVTYFHEGDYSTNLAWDLPYIFFIMRIWIVGNMRFVGGYFQSYVEGSINPEYFAYLFAYQKGASQNETYLTVFPFAEFPYLNGLTPLPLYPVQLAVSPTRDIAFIYSIRGWEPPTQSFHTVGVIIRYQGHEIESQIPIPQAVVNNFVNAVIIFVLTAVLYSELKRKIRLEKSMRKINTDTYPIHNFLISSQD